MKKEVHPTYELTTISCACGFSWETSSTQQDLKVDVCSTCHPFFTHFSEGMYSILTHFSGSPMVPPGASLAETVEDPRIITKRQEFKPTNEGTVSYP